MSGHRIEMRLMGTQSDIDIWLKLLRAMERCQVLEISRESTPFKNRDSEKIFRIYLQLNLSVTVGREVDVVRKLLPPT